MTPPKYDNWRTDTGEKSSLVVCKCICGCEEDIYRGEMTWATINGLVIEDHFEDYVKKELEAKQIYARGD
jgi:hypothetical protein